MKNQVKSIIAQTTFLEKISAHTLRVHVETIPQNKKLIIKINLRLSVQRFNVYYLAVFTYQYFKNYFFYRFFSSTESLF